MCISRQYRLGLRRLLLQKMHDAANRRQVSDRRVAEQIGLSATAYSRLTQGEGNACTVDSMLLYLERLGVRVQLNFTELDDQYSALPNRRKPEQRQCR
jgi:predicted XRE-type DNA-binding protein